MSEPVGIDVAGIYARHNAPGRRCAAPKRAVGDATPITETEARAVYARMNALATARSRSSLVGASMESDKGEQSCP